ncbi:NAD(P)-binding domain-containing protein [Pseudomonas sp. dw_358]|uniref:NAD(P)-binding domain-containing protein n=1 Tax=Pseudomonas sp. dw_358 TaxID=2720083 RepID=UPI001BD21622|nr:NAD(P)-binding domain-containing protein [Pseudomonas sp. dw_358]
MTVDHLNDTSARTVSVLGTGLMGAAVARTLLKHDYSVTVWNRSSNKCRPLLELGALLAASAPDAVAASDTVLLCLLDYPAARAVIGTDLAGKDIINLITGAPAEALEFGQWVELCGGRYLDGAIEAYPDDIGLVSAQFNISGATAAWLQHKAMILCLAGESRFVGTDPAGANVWDAAMLGAFYNVSVGAFHEALAFSTASGVQVADVREALDYWLALLKHKLLESLDAIQAQNYFTDQAALDTYVAAVRSWRQSMLDKGQRASLMTANLHNLELAQAAGFGHEAVFSQYKTARASAGL